MRKLLLSSLLCLAFVLPAGAQHWSLTWEKINAAGPRLKQIGVLATRHSKDITASAWSVGCETLDRDYAVFDNYKDYLGGLGVKSARIQSGWAKCEQKKGKYDFKWLDEIVSGIRGQGVQPWMCLCYGNPLYGANKTLGSRIFTDKETMDAWLKYVEATVKRYKDVVTEWEIWNEPNLRDNAKHPEAYAALLLNTVETIKRIQPEAVIVGFGLSRMPVDFTSSVFEYLKERGKADILDYVSFHPYFENPDDAVPEIMALKECVESYDPTVKLFQGECGCPSILEWGHALRYYEWTEYSQAKWNARRMANDWTLGIRSSIFTLVDLQYPNMLQSFGLVRMNLLKKPVYRRPSYYGVRHMANVLDGSAIPAGMLDYKANSHREISVSSISDRDGKVYGMMLWFSDRIPDDGLDFDIVDITVNGIDLKDPVYLEIITGRVYELPKYYGRNINGNMKMGDLPLWDSPVMVIERSHVPRGDMARAAADKTTDVFN